MNPYDASDVLPPKPDEPVESGPPFFVKPLPRWFVIAFLGTSILVVVLLIITTKIDPRQARRNSFSPVDWLLD